MPAMLVLDCAIVHELTILAASRHHRNLTLEIDECFQNSFLAADRVPGLGYLIARTDQELSLAVVAEGGCLQHGRNAQLSHRLTKMLGGSHLAVRRHRQTSIFQE